jgi:hypothetical protein
VIFGGFGEEMRCFLVGFWCEYAFWSGFKVGSRWFLVRIRRFYSGCK